MKKSLRLFVLLSMVFMLWATIPAHAQGTDCDIQNGALIGTLATGINCVDANGFNNYELQTSGLSVSSLDDVAVCPDDGSILVLNIFGMTKFDGSSWSDVEVPSDVFAPNAVACAPGGNIWIAYMGGITVYDGSSWTNFDKSEFGSSPFIIGVDDVAVGAEGSVWATTSNSVARFNDGTWEVFENGKGYDQDYSLGGLVVNNDGLPTVVHSGGLLTFDGSSWSSQEGPVTVLQTIAVDSNNRVWVGSLTDGVAVLDDGNWTTYTIDDGLASNKIHSIAADAQGRIWVGTEWGLSVLADDAWSTYQMSNSDLLDNNVQHITVIGDGPALPEFQEKANGSIIGVLEDGRDAAPNLQVELCTESLGGVFYGNTPCEGQPGSMLTTTNENGEFSFDDVPVGRYDISIETPTGWIYFIGVDTKVAVEEGQVTDLDDIDISG